MTERGALEYNPKAMNEASVTRYITDTFDGVDIVVFSGDRFFFYNPEGDLPPDHRFPFAST